MFAVKSLRSPISRIRSFSQLVNIFASGASKSVEIVRISLVEVIADSITTMQMNSGTNHLPRSPLKSVEL